MTNKPLPAKDLADLQRAKSLLENPGLLVQAANLLGAASGAALNWIFMTHFQRMAEGHFIVRRLERTYGAAAVRKAY